MGDKPVQPVLTQDRDEQIIDILRDQLQSQLDLQRDNGNRIVEELQLLRQDISNDRGRFREDLTTVSASSNRRLMWLSVLSFVIIAALAGANLHLKYGALEVASAQAAETTTGE